MVNVAPHRTTFRRDQVAEAVVMTLELIAGGAAKLYGAHARRAQKLAHLRRHAARTSAVRPARAACRPAVGRSVGRHGDGVGFGGHDPVSAPMRASSVSQASTSRLACQILDRRYDA